MASTLDDAMQIARRQQFLAVVSTLRADGSIQASLVNAGAMQHPLTGDPAVAFVTYGAVKLGNLRTRPQIAVTFRSDWSWATVEGVADIIGPDDPQPMVDAEQLRLLLRDVFTAAGGTHDDWAQYDRTMVEQRRAAVVVTPSRIYGN
ncbi:MAG TPA: TIGR03618 family F420-dependent PPOX class oxidoreductase [Ilumatobacteraceae bacterium]